MGNCVRKSRAASIHVDEETEENSCRSETLPAEDQTKPTELHYATIDFGFTESIKRDVPAETTAYATIRTDSKDDSDDYDVVLIK